ncbi:MAG: imidazoleglycerol-phosphate dehydratase HisB [Clostridiales bacterium]|nr:imidazoleglycerol-phosphate dehydratase HisB [Clostridiales bacterium]
MKTVDGRFTKISRKTKETDIQMEFKLDGKGNSLIETGVGFFDHMLDSFTRHGFFDMKLNVKGDLYVDAHHTVEDTGIVLGQAIKKTLGDKKGIRRYGFFMLPMDEALISCAVDLSGRPYLSYDLNFNNDRIGYMDTELIKEFFYAVSYNAGINLHINMISGENSHHIAEAAFKAFAKALDEASRFDKRVEDVLSTKGVI